MNEPTPSPAPATSVALPPIPTTSGESTNLPRLLLGILLTIVASDSCFWTANRMGFSVAIFALILTGIILWNRKSWGQKQTTLGLIALMMGASFAAAIETGLTNTLVLLLLVVALSGDTFFGRVESPWGRWFSQGIALIRAPGRPFWLCGILLETTFSEGLGWTGGVIGGCLLSLPALVLALIFGSLLASGNVVFGSWTNDFFNWLWQELTLTLDPWRITSWLFVAFLILPMLKPVQVSTWWWSWTERLPRLPEIAPVRAATLSSGLVLVVLNFLFLIANMADALFLWSGQKLPAGVTYSGFVHSGVNTLSITVILSAIVLTAIFQQSLSVVQQRQLKLLGFAWIVQNLFLLLSVALRLKLYIEAYDMTITRLSVMIFLALVGIGYVLLTVKIAYDRSLSWLVGGCILAVFAIFYLTQFLDLAGWSANYNVAQYEKDRSRNLDFRYLVQLGAPAWPAIRHAQEIDPENKELQEAWHEVSANGDEYARAEWDDVHWREFSLRAWMNRWALEEK